MEDIATVVKQARDEFLEAHTEEKLRKYVKDLLETSLRNVIMHVLGFELSFGSQSKPYFRLDHCNGRSGNSLIGERIKQVVADYFNETLPTFKLEPQEMKALSDELRREYLSYYKAAVREYAREKAKAHARTYVEQEAVALLKGDAELAKLRLMEAK
jgi:hypothetical protein